MIYLRNVTTEAQWLEEPYTGIKRRIDPDAIARVSQQTADHALRTAPGIWSRVVALTPPPPPLGAWKS